MQNISEIFGYELFGTPEKLVMDPVHGGTPFFSHEAQVINHSLFQRLQHICQTDILYMVFPGATHSRFLHSIGTMHVASKIFKGIVRSHIMKVGNQTTSALNPEVVKAIQYFHACLRMAALLHDTGHLPFSHQLEANAEILRLMNASFFKRLWKGADYTLYYNGIPDGIVHEHLSVRYAHQIMADIELEKNFGIEPQDVISIMDTTKCSPSKEFAKYVQVLSRFFQGASLDENLLPENQAKSLTELSTLTELLTELLTQMISGELGADRMDYLLRDSYFSGSMYGVYNLDHLVSSLQADVKLKEPSIKITIRKKEVGALEDFVNSRFQLYQHVFYHKTVVGLQWLLAKAISEILSQKGRHQYITGTLTDPNRFAQFTDSFFWEEFRDYALRNQKSACAKLISREKLIYVRTEKQRATFELEALESKWSAEGRRVFYQDRLIKFSKLGTGKDQIRVSNDAPTFEEPPIQAISSISDFFQKFIDVRVSHFYYVPDGLDC